jgi:3'(2'), 5'-bisphosphate nucleotidase
VTSSDLNNLLLLAIQSAFIAGKTIMQVYGNDHLLIKRKKDFSPLTLADQSANEVLMGYLEKTQIPVISEEGKQYEYTIRKDWEFFWLVDPLDGTKDFLKRNGEFTVNIALINYNLPLIGVVYAPASGHLYYGAPAIGSYLLSTGGFQKEIPADMPQIVRLSEKLPFRTDRVHYTIVSSRSHVNFETQRYIMMHKKQYSRTQLISKGSSLKFCLVAEGSADIYPRFGPTMEWDTAAGQAVAVHSGCSVARYDTGDVLAYNKKELRNPWFIVRRVERDIITN